MTKKERQFAESVGAEAPATPGDVGPSVLQRPMPRSVVWALIVAAILLAIAVLPHARSLHIYERHLRSEAPEVQVAFERLDGKMDEAAFQAQLPGVKMRCYAEPEAGRRVCFADLRSANGVPALVLAAFFQRGRLTTAFLHVPWWAHGRARDALNARWGASVPGGKDETGKPMRHWKLPNGTIAMNDSRYAHPLQWSAVVWVAQ
jgi:hypothetical protein